MKKGPLSNKEKEHIESFYKTTPVKDLASRMDRSLSIVKKFVDKLPTEEEVQKEEPPKQPSVASNLLARNKEQGVVIMTEGSSMESDKNRKPPQPPGRYSRFIHKIKED